MNKAYYVCRGCDGHFEDIESKNGHICPGRRVADAVLQVLREANRRRLSASRRLPGLSSAQAGSCEGGDAR